MAEVPGLLCGISFPLHVAGLGLPQTWWSQDSWISFFFFLIFIGVELTYNVVLVSGIQQSESVIHIHISILFQILFPYRSLQSIE